MFSYDKILGESRGWQIWYENVMLMLPCWGQQFANICHVMRLLIELSMTLFGFNLETKRNRSQVQSRLKEIDSHFMAFYQTNITPGSQGSAERIASGFKSIEIINSAPMARRCVRNKLRISWKTNKVESSTFRSSRDSLVSTSCLLAIEFSNQLVINDAE